MSFEQAEASVITKRPSDTDDLKQRVDYLQDVKKELSNKIVERDRKIMEVRHSLFLCVIFSLRKKMLN